MGSPGASAAALAAAKGEIAALAPSAAGGKRAVHLGRGSPRAEPRMAPGRDKAHQCAQLSDAGTRRTSASLAAHGRARWMLGDIAAGVPDLAPPAEAGEKGGSSLDHHARAPDWSTDCCIWAGSTIMSISGHPGRKKWKRLETADTWQNWVSLTHMADDNRRKAFVERAMADSPSFRLFFGRRGQ